MEREERPTQEWPELAGSDKRRCIALLKLNLLERCEQYLTSRFACLETQMGKQADDYSYLARLDHP